MCVRRKKPFLVNVQRVVFSWVFREPSSLLWFKGLLNRIKVGILVRVDVLI